MAKSHKFDIYDAEDIENEMYIIALDGFQRYDEDNGKLEHFLRVHIRNRILDLKRNKFINNQSSVAEEKLKVLSPVSIGLLSESSFAEDAKESIDGLSELISSKLSASLREPYLKLLEGVRIPSSQKKKVVDAIKIIAETQKDDD